MKPEFSILTATYNCLPYVGQCIRSVLSQTSRDWEMIIVDDCSKDRTYERVCEITSKHDNIQVLRNRERMYCGPTYRRLLGLANGKYCGVLDGDDVLVPEAVATILDCYKGNPSVDFIWTKHRWFNTKMDKSREGLSSAPKHGTIYDSENNLKHVYSHWRTFKTELRNKTRLFTDLKCSVDKNLGYTLEEVSRGGFLPKALYHYRYHKENMSHHSTQKAMWREIRKHHKNKNRFPSRIVR